MYNIKDIKDIKKILDYLEEIVCVIDKIGSGFSDTEETALALLLFFKEKQILDKLSFVRKILTIKLSNILDESEYEQWLNENVDFWNPPYNKSVKELMEMIKKK
jgi:hypothetical protein